MRVRHTRESVEGFIGRLDKVPETAVDFLELLGVEENHYLLALRLDLSKATVMLRRLPRHIMVNTFNPAIASLWHGDCDMQLV